MPCKRIIALKLIEKIDIRRDKASRSKLHRLGLHWLLRWDSLRGTRYARKLAILIGNIKIIRKINFTSISQIIFYLNLQKVFIIGFTFSLEEEMI